MTTTYSFPLEIQSLPDPKAAWGQVVVRMIASPINPSDLLTIRNLYGRQPALPFVPGFEGVGRVISGKGPLAWRVMGRRVAVITPEGGAWADQCLIPAIRAIPLPDSIPDDQGASFFVNPATAWAMVRNVLGVRSGDLLIQSAAAGAARANSDRASPRRAASRPMWRRRSPSASGRSVCCSRSPRRSPPCATGTIFRP